MSRLLPALACLLLAACALHPVQPPAAPPTVALAQRQLLVTLRLPPAHFRADGDYVGDYAAGPGAAARRAIARRVAARYHLVLLDAWPIPALRLDCFLMQSSGDAVTPALLRRLAADARVASVQPLHLYRSLGGKDPLYALQPVVGDWQLDRLHARATGRRVTVAEVDSGVDVTHPDLRGQVAATRDFVGDGGYRAEAHGTEVGGIIVARANNGLGIAGVAPDARLLALRACWQTSQDGAACSSFTLAKAVQYALQARAQVLNLSLAGPDDPLLGQLLDVARAQGIAVVAAVDGRLPRGGFPADHAGVLAVAGERDGTRVPDALRAPWRDIPTTQTGARWGFVSGTSFAAAQVSGLVALLRQMSPGLPPARLRAALDRQMRGSAAGSPSPACLPSDLTKTVRAAAHYPQAAQAETRPCDAMRLPSSACCSSPAPVRRFRAASRWRRTTATADSR